MHARAYVMARKAIMVKTTCAPDRQHSIRAPLFPGMLCAFRFDPLAQSSSTVSSNTSRWKRKRSETSSGMNSSSRGSPRARLTEFSRYAVLDPLRTPPVDRRDRAPAEQHREMQMITAGESGRSAASKLLAHLHAVTALHADGR